MQKIGTGLKGNITIEGTLSQEVNLSYIECNME